MEGWVQVGLQKKKFKVAVIHAIHRKISYQLHQHVRLKFHLKNPFTFMYFVK